MEIRRGNSWAEIRGAPPFFLYYLGRHLSVVLGDSLKRGARFGSVWEFGGEPYGSLLHENRVAAGLVPHVKVIAEYYGLPCSVVDIRSRPTDGLPLWALRADWRPYQDDIHAAILKYEGGVIDAPPRSGKTLMAARVIDTLNLPTLYIAPSVAIVRQTVRVLTGIFGEDFVSAYDGDSKMAGRVDVSKHIVVSTAMSAARLPREWYDTRDILIVDEFHHSAAETYHVINQLAENVYYRFMFTGTHFRTGDDFLAMQAVCSSVLHKVHVVDLIPTYLAQPWVCFLSNPSPVSASRDWRAVYRSGIVESKSRNAKVVAVANRMMQEGIPTIVLTRRRAHADALGDAIINSVVVKGGESSLTSQSIQDFLAGRYQVLVGTTVLGEGVDVPNAGALIYASGGADGVTMAQSYFRPMTAFPGKSKARIYDFLDHGNSILSRHSLQRFSFARQQLGERAVFAV